MGLDQAIVGRRLPDAFCRRAVARHQAESCRFRACSFRVVSPVDNPLGSRRHGEPVPEPYILWPHLRTSPQALTSVSALEFRHPKIFAARIRPGYLEFGRPGEGWNIEPAREERKSPRLDYFGQPPAVCPGNRHRLDGGVMRAMAFEDMVRIGSTHVLHAEPHFIGAPVDNETPLVDPVQISSHCPRGIDRIPVTV